MIHIYTYLISSFLAFLASILPRKVNFLKAILILVSSLLLFLPLALRADFVGIDTPAYYSIFHMINSDTDSIFSYRYEPGYVFINKALSGNSFGAAAVIFLASFLSFYSLFFVICNKNNSLILSIAVMCGLGVYGFMYNGVRQAIALGFLMFTLSFFYDKNIKKYSFFIFLSACFHYTALAFFSGLILGRVKLRKVGYPLLWVISLLFLSQSMAGIVSNLLSHLVPDVYVSYVSGDLKAGSVRLRIFTNQIFILFFIFVVFYLDDNRLSDYKRALLNLSFFGFIFSNVFFHLGYIDRVSLYFQAVSIIAVPMFLKDVFDKKSFYILGFFAYFIFSLIYIRGLLLGANGMIPYQTFL